MIARETRRHPNRNRPGTRPPTPLLVGALAAALLAGCGADRSPKSDATPGAESPAGETARALPPQDYPPAAEEALETALAAYEGVRAVLAADRTEGLAERASRLAPALTRAADATADASPAAASLLEEGARIAESLAEAPDLATAREAFSELNRVLLPVVGADPELAAGRYVYECPMVEGFNRWIQPEEGIENPFMGRAMPTCGSPSDWTTEAPETLEGLEAHAEHAHAPLGEGAEEGGIAYYTCSMHPSVQQQGPGTCPICSMDLVPVTREEIETGTILVDAARRQAIGVTTAPAERRRLETTLRAVGSVVYDERRLAEVSVKYRGWIGDLHVDEPGQPVRRGQTLFTLYSPELYAAQQEYLAALESQRAARSSGVPERADYLVEAARKRLRLWDLRGSQIDRVAETGEPVQYIPIVSPVSGHVVEKNVVAGSSVQPGATLYRIAGLDSVWVEAELYESELSRVEVGQTARVTLPYLPGRSFTGRVAFIYPYLDGARRTGRVRVELANPDLVLKPDMFAHVVLESDLGERLVVPEEAVLYAGERSFVFVDLGEGRLQPTAVETGVETADFVEVLSGLEAGDPVVTSGNFLIAAESRLKLAMEHWR